MATSPCSPLAVGEKDGCYLTLTPALEDPGSDESTTSLTGTGRSKWQESKLNKDIFYLSDGSADDSLQTFSRGTPTHFNTEGVTDDDSHEASTPIIPVLKQRFFRGRPVKPKDQNLPEYVLEFKQRRRVRTAASAWTGGIIGLVSAGPLGAALGATAAYGIAKGVGKAKERRLVESSGGHFKSNTGINRALYDSALV